MSKLHSSRKIAQVLEKRGFFFISQRGSHAKFRKHAKDKTYTVIVPMGKKEIPLGTFRSILRQSGLDKKSFS